MVQGKSLRNVILVAGCTYFNFPPKFSSAFSKIWQLSDPPPPPQKKICWQNYVFLIRNKVPANKINRQKFATKMKYNICTENKVDKRCMCDVSYRNWAFISLLPCIICSSFQYSLYAYIRDLQIRILEIHNKISPSTSLGLIY